ncbi:MAG: hypothetical protein COS99_05420 [Candidatus Omnitrophica bacterium CG07_land_8_20_14_0_80_42_15]|uniref:Uncharacterized protein n=1 Tax=Candidatus Aquitaenariimonas noxiae TaxID=1974741 RepID=A0A2J0L2D5_9BACT|nr:MAG: hypothetical protein COS99_05420 [Candidatus Omnitrophica bacterium CG07_land_8_20_14_0_80_42_15]
MARGIKGNFNKRFGDRIQVVYAQSLSPSERELRNKKLCEAVIKVLTGILGREPTERELFGIDDLAKVKRRK